MKPCYKLGSFAVATTAASRRSSGSSGHSGLESSCVVLERASRWCAPVSSSRRFSRGRVGRAGLVTAGGALVHSMRDRSAAEQLERTLEGGSSRWQGLVAEPDRRSTTASASSSRRRLLRSARVAAARCCPSPGRPPPALARRWLIALSSPRPLTRPPTLPIHRPPELPLAARRVHAVMSSPPRLPSAPTGHRT